MRPLDGVGPGANASTRGEPRGLHHTGLTNRCALLLSGLMLCLHAPDDDHSGALQPERAPLRRLEPVAARRQRLAAGANQWLMTPLGGDIPVVFDFFPLFFFSSAVILVENI